MSIIASSSPNLAGLGREGLQHRFAELGEQPFRATQVMKWIHHRGVTDVDAMTDISKPLRKTLADTIYLPKILSRHVSADGTRKWLIAVGGGKPGDNKHGGRGHGERGIVETVFIPEEGRGTLCISSQVGCALDCDFCATGKQGFSGHLSSGEIVGQLWLANHELGGFNSESVKPITNVVMMGMGEPLLNFEPVMEAIDIMLDDYGYGLSKRRVTISTAGVVPAIERMRGRTQACLALSLHAPNDELRSRLMPINRRYPIRQVLDAVAGYMASLPDSRLPLMEYTLIKGVNDHRQHSRQLAQLLQDYPCKINLIPFNPFSGSDFQAPSAASLSRFRQTLQDAGFVVTVRSTRGADINAACGQLSACAEAKTRTKTRSNKPRYKKPQPQLAATAMTMTIAMTLALGACVSGERIRGDTPFAPQASTEQALQDYVELAFAYYNAGDMRGARRHISNALDLDGRDSEAHHALALVQEREGDGSAAERSYRQSLDFDRRNSRARNNYAAFLFAQERYAEAYRQLEMVTADTAYQGRAIAFENLGRSALSLQRSGAAETAFERALSLNPGLYVSLLELARLHAGRGDWPAARARFRQYSATMDAYDLPHTPQALLTGIDIETWFVDNNRGGDRDLLQSYATLLQRLHPNSAEYKQYQESQESRQ